MNLYLDDDVADPVLAALLRRAGHDVQLPTDVGLLGGHDAVHWQHAVREKRIIISMNYSDFEPMHHLILETTGHHPGVWVVRKDNDRKRDLTNPGIVRAISKLLTTGSNMVDRYVVLNQWR